MNQWLTLSLWVGAVGNGVMAGVYFTFSAFVMRALAVIPRGEAMLAMQSINRVILSSVFMPLFFGTTVVATGLAVGSLVRFQQWGTPAILAGGVIYVVGMFVCTAALNVPLNDELAATSPSSPQAASIWDHYVRRWTQWNHIRTLCSAVSCILFIQALRGQH